MEIKTTRQILEKTLRHIIKNQKELGYNYHTKWVKVDDLIIWLQDTFGNADNVNLILNDLGRLKNEIR